jgi:hypothetical protein
MISKAYVCLVKNIGRNSPLFYIINVLIWLFETCLTQEFVFFYQTIDVFHAVTKKNRKCHVKSRNEPIQVSYQMNKSTHFTRCSINALRRIISLLEYAGDSIRYRIRWDAIQNRSESYRILIWDPSGSITIDPSKGWGRIRQWVPKFRFPSELMNCSRTSFQRTEPIELNAEFERSVIWPHIWKSITGST